ncbi:MAG: hypothetical protein AABZ64_16920, partial [Nitrospinota bacterium]
PLRRLVRGVNHLPLPVITIGAGQGGQFLFGDNSTSQTAKTRIDAGAGAQIVGSNAAIVQSPDGSIRFYVGGDEGK